MSLSTPLSLSSSTLSQETYRSSTSLRSLHPSRAASTAFGASAATSATAIAAAASGVVVAGADVRGGGGGGESVPNEERFWARKYGLGRSSLVPKKKRNKNKGERGGGVAPSRASLRTIGNVPATCLLFGPRGVGGISSSEDRVRSPPGATRSGSFHPLAVVGGPRVAIYGPGPHSHLARALRVGSSGGGKAPNLFGAGKEKERADGSNERDSDDNDDDNDVKPERTIGTGGRPAHCASYRRDGRLLALGTDGGYVRICDARTRAVLRTFGGSARGAMGMGGASSPSSTLPVRCTAWLGDGRRIVSGGDDGVVRVWDLSGGGGGEADGGIASASVPALALRGHGDSVRSIVVVRTKRAVTTGTTRAGESEAAELTAMAATDLAVSGSYDHTIRVWDLGIDPNVDDNDGNGNAAENRLLSILNHGAPVECLLTLPPCPASRRLHRPRVASGGGTHVKIWDVLTGTCLCNVPTYHSKTVTSLCLVTLVRNDPASFSVSDVSGIASEEVDKGNAIVYGAQPKKTNLRLLTAGLDGLIRIHSADELLSIPSSSSLISNGKGTILTLPYLHGIRLPHPITSMAISPDNARLAIGTSTGVVHVRQRAKIVRQGATLASATVGKKRRASPRAGTYSHFMRGADEMANADDHIVMQERKKKLKPYDVMLRQFRYGDAVDEALASRQPDAVVAVLEELSKRPRGLSQALSNRDEETLEPLLSFTARYVARPRYSSVLVGVAEGLIDIYGDFVGRSEVVDECFGRLRHAVREECAMQKTLLGIVGQIDAVLCAAEMHARRAEEEEEDEDEQGEGED